MPDPIIPSPGSGNPADTGSKPKTTEELMAELAEVNKRTATLEKQVKDKEEFVNRQATEIGELRKRIPAAPKSEAEQVIEDEEVAEVAKDFKSMGLDDENAKFNAELVVRAGRKREARKMMGEVIDIIDEQIEEGKLPEFVENQNEIMEEFKTRKLAPTARKNIKLLKTCYETVIKRKAEALSKGKEQETEKEREARIAQAGIPPAGGGKPNAADTADEEMRKSIRNAGSSGNSVFGI